MKIYFFSPSLELQNELDDTEDEFGPILPYGSNSIFFGAIDNSDEHDEADTDADTSYDSTYTDTDDSSNIESDNENDTSNDDEEVIEMDIN